MLFGPGVRVRTAIRRRGSGSLHDVSFTIPEKTSTAIVGPSSSGKTTLCFAVQRAEDLLRKVERVVFAMIVGQARIRSKIFQRQGIFLCQRAGGS